jgi:methionyl aminopeptidase
VITVAAGAELVRFRNCCRMAAELRERLRAMVAPGLELREMDEAARAWLDGRGARSWFKGYRGYPAHICASVNEEVIHGIPGGRRLKDGDIVSIDLGVEHGGFCSDTAFTAPVGAVDEAAGRVMRVTREALERGIAQAKAGNRVGDISAAVQGHVETAGFSVVREFVGHGIGRKSHEDPQIPNYGHAGTGTLLVAGQALAIEPMVNEGLPGIRILEDGWTTVTADGKRSAHFEHTVLVTTGAPEVMTGSPEAAG